MVNTVLDGSILQLLYNLIHWFLGIALVAAAFVAYKQRGNRRSIIAPLIIATAGFIFIVYVLVGFKIYYVRWLWPWELTHEHLVHFYIGSCWLIGGLLAAFSNLGKIHRFFYFALPLSLAAGGLLFATPHQHGGGGDPQYMLMYHYILGVLLALSGIAMAVARSNETRRNIAFLAMLVSILPGLFFLAYRHPLTVTARCAVHSQTHTIDLSKAHGQTLPVDLCDRIVLTTTDGKIYYPAIGSHSAHAHYPNFWARLIQAGSNNTFTAAQSGTYPIHDHASQRILIKLVISERPGTNNWRLIRY